jgi:hypothetical protein
MTQWKKPLNHKTATKYKKEANKLAATNRWRDNHKIWAENRQNLGKKRHHILDSRQDMTALQII